MPPGRGHCPHRPVHPVWQSRGDGTFFLAGTVSDGQNERTSVLVSGDFAHDGKTDLLAGLQLSLQMALFTNMGGGAFQRSFCATGVSTTGMLAVDLNNDGKLDLVISNYELSYRPPSAVVIFGQ